MGMYASAYLRFGVVLDGERDEYGYLDLEDNPPVWYDPDEGIKEIDEIVANARGVTSPYDLVPDEINHGSMGDFDRWVAQNPEWEATRDRWFDLKRKIREESPVEIKTYGHHEDDEPRGLIVLKAAPVFTVDTWEVAEVVLPPAHELHDLSVIAQGYCASVGLEFEDPKWLLTASYG